MSKSLWFLVMGFIFCCSISSCMKITKKTDAKNSEPAHVETKLNGLTRESIQYTLQGENQPNVYRLNFEWPSVPEIVRVILKNSSGIENTENRKYFKNLLGGKTYEFLIEQIADDGRILFSLTQFITVPTDFVLAGAIELSEDVEENVERLFIKSDARLLAFNYNFKINAKNIFSEKGALLSYFPNRAVADVDQNGRSSGGIELIADQIVGELNVIVNAEEGGVGKNGYAITGLGGMRGVCYPNNGGDGGNAGSLFIKAVDSSNFLVSISQQNTMGGVAGRIVDMDVETDWQRKDQKYYKSKSENCKNPSYRAGAPGQRGRIKLLIDENSISR